MNWLYLATNAAMFFPVLIASAVPFFPTLRWQRVLKGTILLAAPFIVWDIWATSRGHWAFAAQYTFEWRFLGLPLEEVLFFITAPIGCWYILAAVQTYLPNRRIHLPIPVVTSTLVTLLAATVLSFEFEYLFVVLLLCSLMIGVFLWQLQKSKIQTLQTQYLWYYFFSFIAFGFFNSILTSVPIVTYGEAHTIGIRVGSIPVEDFFYNFLLVTAVLVADRKLK